MFTPRNISHYRGDSLALKLRLWEDTEQTVPANLSQAIVTGQVRANPDDSEVACSFDIAIADNEIVAALSPKSARNLPALASWDIEVDFYGDDSVVETVAGGKIATAPDTTRTN